MFSCPVCYFDRMPDPPEDYNICPCCGTEFGYDDELKTFAQLRMEWIAGGMRWFFREPPPFWDPQSQLANRRPCFEGAIYVPIALPASEPVPFYSVYRYENPNAIDAFIKLNVGDMSHQLELSSYIYSSCINVHAPIVLAANDGGQQYEREEAKIKPYELALAS